MRRQELRLATVIYGGVSLAVYMHGVTKELHKLVRASKLYHNNQQQGRNQPWSDCNEYDDADSEAAYFSLLKDINEDIDLRVVVDVIAGASAGAISGGMLAKAIAKDLSLDAQTEVWLSRADVEELAADSPSTWGSWYKGPLSRFSHLLLPLSLRSDTQTREKLKRLVRSIRLRAPLSGRKLCTYLLEGLSEMNASQQWDASLMPYGQRLDFFASITDLQGYARPMLLTGGSATEEREHAVVCRLSHLETNEARDNSDFAPENDPALVWAARASSSYTGAFPPYRHEEMLAVLNRREQQWPGAAQFLANKLRARNGRPLQDLRDPADCYFVDGAIVNNKPFSSALDALAERPADRHVDRALLYIDPTPDLRLEQRKNLGQRYVATILAAASAIPRHQPITDDLTEVMEHNERALLNQQLAEDSSGAIQKIVAKMLQDRPTDELTGEFIGQLRQRSGERTAIEYGLAYPAYLQRRLWRLTDSLASNWLQLLGKEENITVAPELREAIVGIWRDPDASSWEAYGHRNGFLDRFDVTYRLRRLQFVIRQLNQRHDTEVEQSHFDHFKRATYDYVGQLYAILRGERLPQHLQDALSGDAQQMLDPGRIAETFDELGDSFALAQFDRDYDAAFAQLCNQFDDPDIRLSLIADYAGFTLFDVLLTTGGSNVSGPDPLTPIRTERISPRDVSALAPVFDGLLGSEMANFAGFFNRRFREHDYLWGRLHAAEKLVHLLFKVSNLSKDALADHLQNLFLHILRSERGRLTQCAELIDRLEIFIQSEQFTRGTPPTASDVQRLSPDEQSASQDA